MRSMTGAETFCAIRSYLATAGLHGISWLDAVILAVQGKPWIPEPVWTGHPCPRITTWRAISTTDTRRPIRAIFWYGMIARMHLAMSLQGSA